MGQHVRMGQHELRVRVKSSKSECVVYVPVQYDGQSTTNVWSMYRYGMMVSLQGFALRA
jgi:hypothetical protein